jgi:hypothetical protein
VRVIFARLFAATGYIALMFAFFLTAFVAGQQAKRARL